MRPDVAGSARSQQHTRVDGPEMTRTRRAGGAPSAAWEAVRVSMWGMPAVATLTALAVTVLLLQVSGDSLPSTLARLLWPGDPTSASSVMQTLATAAVTTTSLTFSAVLVALQLASQQFSPRLLRDFARDRFTQGVLALLLSTFASAVTVLRSLDARAPMPVAALCWVYVLGLAAIALLLGFLAHMMRQLRVDTMMRTVHRQAAHAIDATYPSRDSGDHVDPPDDPGDVGEAVIVHATRSGFCRRVYVDALVATAAGARAYVRVIVRPGDQVLLGTPIAYAWPVGDGSRDAIDLSEVRVAIDLGHERTFEQDPAFGFRRLADVAVKAISPGINDPATAAQAVGHMGDLLVRLQDKHLGPAGHRDDGGTVRVTVPDRDLRYYLDLTCAQIRRYGKHDAAVLTALLRMLRDVALSAQDDHQRAELRRQRDLVLDEIPEELAGEDSDGVRDAADRVLAALHGRVDEAFRDDNGHLRSI